VFTLVVANHKGGVGKTATVHALGAALAQRGKRVLLADLDPQGSLTGACGMADIAERGSLADVLGGATPGRFALREVVQQLDEGLYLAPSSIRLAAAQLGLISRMGRENVVKKALNLVSGVFDIAVLDTAPSLGLLTVAALVAADAVLIPTQPQAADLRGLVLFLDTVTQVREELNPHLRILGVLVTFYEGRYRHHHAAVEAMQRNGVPLLPLRIGRSVRVAEAMGAGESVITYDPDNPRSAEYQALAEHIIQWQNETQT